MFAKGFSPLACVPCGARGESERVPALSSFFLEPLAMLATAAVAGAVIAAKKKQQEQQRRINSRRRRDMAAAATAFDRLDTERRGALTRDEARRLLQTVLGAQHTVSEEGLDCVFVPATVAAKEAAAASMREEQNGTIQIEPLATKQELIRGIAQYRAFLARYDEVSNIIAQHDKTHTGVLNRDEMAGVIVDAEKELRKRNLQLGYEPPKQDAREVWGITMELMPTEQDIDAIFEQCDANGDGCIGRSEMLPALALWAQLAHERIEREKVECCCGAGASCTVS